MILLMNSEERKGLRRLPQREVNGLRGVDPGAPMNLENELGKGRAPGGAIDLEGWIQRHQ